jgi:L-threonylcarbamoyladenylate synthase
MSATFDCSQRKDRAVGLAAAIAAVRSGQLVVLPTDTCYGVGCDVFSGRALRRLREAKRRGPDTPVPVLVGSWAALDDVALDIPGIARELIEAFWPGGLSLVLTHAPSLDWALGDTRGTVMVRMPLHPFALELLDEVGPMAVSGANTSGNLPATTIENARLQLGDSVSVYVQGYVPDSLPSTIIDLTTLSEPRLLREGVVSAPAISEVIGREVSLVRPDA